VAEQTLEVLADGGHQPLDVHFFDAAQAESAETV